MNNTVLMEVLKSSGDLICIEPEVLLREVFLFLPLLFKKLSEEFLH